MPRIDVKLHHMAALVAKIIKIISLHSQCVISNVRSILTFILKNNGIENCDCHFLSQDIIYLSK